jgi:hypothetical protein
MGKTLLVVPEAPAVQAAAAAGERALGAKGLRLGTLDNSKGNADHLLRLLVDGLRAALPVASVVALRKPHPTLAAESQVLDSLASEADCVFTAMAD